MRVTALKLSKDSENGGGQEFRLAPCARVGQAVNDGTNYPCLVQAAGKVSTDGGASCKEKESHHDLKGSILLLLKKELHFCTYELSVESSILNMSSLPPVYIVSAARTPTGMFLGYVFLSKRGAVDSQLTTNIAPSRV
jgi:hypothetical protein